MTLEGINVISGLLACKNKLIISRVITVSAISNFRLQRQMESNKPELKEAVKETKNGLCFIEVT